MFHTFRHLVRYALMQPMYADAPVGHNNRVLLARTALVGIVFVSLASVALVGAWVHALLGGSDLSAQGPKDDVRSGLVIATLVTLSIAAFLYRVVFKRRGGEVPNSSDLIDKRQRASAAEQSRPVGSGCP